MAKKSKQGITVQKERNFSDWYTEVIQKSELIEYTDVSGCYILRPTAFEIWNKIKHKFNSLIKADGVENAYFPLLIPEKLLKKEQAHVKGFTPEVAWVTHTGETKLPKRLAIRPTSETIMYPAYSKWIRSWKDLPLRLNQWVNIVRWEFKHPVPFLRSREFLWQEGHTVFATKQEAEDEAKKILKFYKEIFQDLLAIPVLEGIKSEKEKFAGANYSLSLETFLPNGKAIQCCTSHYLGQNFSKPFNIKFLNKTDQKEFAYQNSWGLTTRSIGITIMTHSDNHGLVLPPKIAPTQVIIIPIIFKDSKTKVLEQANKIKSQLKGIKINIDEREDHSPGRKFNEYELKGIPIRIEIGPKDLKAKSVMVVRRDNLKKQKIKITELKKQIPIILEQIQKSLFQKAKRNLKPTTGTNLKQLQTAIKNNKLALTNWCKSKKCEDMIKYKTGGAKTLVMPFKNNPRGKCVYCGKKSQTQIYIAKSY